MIDLRHMLEDVSAVRTARAGGSPRRRSIARHLMSRVLPGGMVVLAALTVPELSVGAGDLGGGDHADDPPLPPPPSFKQTPTARLGAVRVQPGLAGVRYAPVLDLEPAPVLTLTAAMEWPVAREPEAPATAPAPSAASLPVEAAPPPALVSPPVVSAIINAPSAAETSPLAAIAPPPATPVVAMPTVPAASLPVATELAAAAEPVPVRPIPAGLDQPNQVPAAAVAMAVSLPEPIAALPQTAAIAASVPAGGGVGTEALADPPAPAPAVSVLPASSPVPAPATRAAASPPLPPLPAAGLRAPVAAPPPAKAPAPAIAAVPQPRPALSAPLAAGSSPFPLDAKAQLVTRVDGKTAGAVDFRQTPQGLIVRIGSVVEVLADRFAPDEIARIRASSAGDTYVSLAELQAKGIPISYDPVYDEFNVGLTDTRPKSARKVHIDQITSPERGIDATGMAQVPRPR